MNYFRKKRQEKGIKSSDMARMLGIDYNKYIEIDRGDRKMPTNLIDKFNEIISRGKNEIKLETLNNEKEINDWFEKMSANNGRKLREKMYEFNIYQYKDLAELLGCKPCTISGYITKGKEASYNFKSKLYTFFQDELNIQTEQKNKLVNFKTERKIKRRVNVDKSLLDYYNDFNIEEWLNKNNLTYLEFAKMYNIPKSTFFYYVRRKARPTNATIIKIKKAIEDYENKKLKKDNTELAKIKSNILLEELIDKYDKKTEELNQQTLVIAKNISDLQRKLAEINNKRAIYDEIIKELQGDEN